MSATNVDDPRSVLTSYAVALGREAHHLVRSPELMWQQMDNRLQWEPDPAIAARLDAARRARAASRPPVFHTRSPEDPATEPARMLIGHSTGPRVCEWSPDGARLATGRDDVRLWSPVTGQELVQLDGHRNVVTGCAWSPDGQRIVTSSYDGALRLFDTSSGACERTLIADGVFLLGCSWSPDGTAFALCGENGAVHIWRVDGSASVSLPAHTPGPTCVAWNPNGTWLASVGVDSVRFWNAQEGTLRAEGALHTQRPTCAWDPAGRYLAIGTQESVAPPGGVRSVHVVDSHRSSFACVLEPLEGESSGITHFAWSPDGCALATVEGRRLRVWHVPSGTERCRSELVQVGANRCSWHPNGTLIVTSSNNGLRMWDAVDCRLRTHLPSGADSFVIPCAWSPDGTWIASAGLHGPVSIYDADDALRPRLGGTHSGSVRVCRFSPDGTLVASAADDNSVRLWDGEDAHEQALLEGHTARVLDVSWSPDSRQLASGAGDAVVHLWDVTTGVAAHACKGHTPEVRRDADRDIIGRDGVHAVAWSPVGDLVASAGNDATVRVWNAHTGIEMQVLTGHRELVLACSWSPDGRFLASAGGDPEVLVWDTERAFESRRFLSSAWRITSCNWSPDGGKIAVVGPSDKTVVYSLDDSKSYVLHGGTPVQEPWSPDGNWLLLTDKGHLGIWSAESGTVRSSLGRGWYAAWSPDGSWVAATGSERGTVDLYRADGGAHVATLPAVDNGYCLSLHPWRPTLAVGYSSGRVAILDLAGVEYGPIVVTAVARGDRINVVCPRCAQAFVMPREQLGTVVSCTGCAFELRLNPFTRPR